MRLVSGRSLLSGSFSLVTGGTRPGPYRECRCRDDRNGLGETGLHLHPWSLDPKAAAGGSSAAGPNKLNRSYYHVYNSAFAQLMSKHAWNVAGSDIVTGGMTAQQAADGDGRRL
jgi:hypothetical protein